MRIPVPARDSGSCYAKLKRKTGDFATAAAAVLLKLDGDIVLDVSIALTNVGPTALKATDAETSLRRRPLTDGAITEAPAWQWRSATPWKTSGAMSNTSGPWPAR